MEQKNDSGQQTELVLRDLESLLQKSIGNDVTIVNYSTSSLLPKGENYGSTVLKVEAVIKRSKNSPEEKLPLVAKMIPTTDFVKDHFDTTASFVKEIFFFESLIPKYRELQEDAGVDDEELLNILPKYYGGRLTRNVENPDVADEDAVMLMENLKVRGYYTSDRRHGLNFDHAKVAITELAKFHALGMAVRIKNSKFINDASQHLNACPFSMKEGEFNEVIDHIVNTVCKDPTVAKSRDRIKSNLDAYNWNSFLTKEQNEEPWVTIIHGDFWVNNFMFHQNNGKVDDIKFIDFQISQITSPQKDLPYFLCGSLHIDVLNDGFEVLLDMYYNKFIKTLNAVGQDTTELSRQSFDEKLRKVANTELFHCLMAVQFFTQKGGDDLDLNDLSSIMMSDSNELFEKRATAIILKFIEKDWL